LGWAMFFRDLMAMRLATASVNKCIVETCNAPGSHEAGWCTSHGAAADACFSLAFIHEQVHTGAADLSDAIRSARAVVKHLQLLAKTSEWRARPSAVSAISER
jgi:hypothetical protein